MTTVKPSGIINGTIAKLSETHAKVTDAQGATWHVPRDRLPPTVQARETVTLCVLAGNTPEREALARAMLNQLLG